MSAPETTIPKGSWVLISGATGHIAAHTIKIFLERGFKVRGTVRDFDKAAWLTQDVFKSFADSGDFELALVPDLGVKGAFDESLKGVSAVVHIASDLSFSNDVRKVIPPVVDGINYMLEAACKVPSIKSFVYTSSIAAAVSMDPGVVAHVGRDTWHDEVVKVAWSPPPHSPTHWHHVYMASKVEAEKAVWAFAEKNKPHFSIASVLPSTVMGEGFAKRHLELPYPWVKKVYDGDDDIGDLFKAVIHVDVKDAALLHVAAVLDPECAGARIQAWGEYVNFNDLLAVLRKLCPDKKFRGGYPGQTKLEVTTDYEPHLALLKKWGGQDGVRTLEQSVADELEGIRKWYNEDFMSYG